MTSTKPSRIVFDSFTDVFRRHSRIIVARGFGTIKSSIVGEKDEENITDALFHAIDIMLEGNNPRWYKHYEVHNERPISGGKRKGRSRREIDLAIRLTSDIGRPEYVFESKPLNYSKSHQREGNYINEQALQRFLKGEYAEYTARFPEVGMLGYVLSDTVEFWRDKLKAAILVNQGKLRLIGEQRNALIIGEFPYEWTSTHSRDSSQKPVIIYHILLDCCSSSNSEDAT